MIISYDIFKTLGEYFETLRTRREIDRNKPVSVG